MKITKLLQFTLPCLIAWLALGMTEVRAAAPKIKVLIIDGQNNHQWAETTPYLKAILEQTGIFTVSVSTTPPGPMKAPRLAKDATPEQKADHDILAKEIAASEVVRKAGAAEAWAKWRPHFADYDVIVSNYNGEDWPEAVRTAFVEFVRNGGGFVSYHAADNSFANWPEYNAMIGVGGWGGRTEKSGPYLRLRDAAWTKVEAPGPSGGHGPRKEFLVTTFAPLDPIMKDLPAKWMHSEDELYCSLRGPAESVNVLGNGLSTVTHEQEPLLMTLTYGKGRVFHTTLGHYVEALNGLGFQVTFTRGTEWAATGTVTLPAPKPGELTETGKAAERVMSVK